MMLAIPRSTLEQLLDNAAVAAHLVGHLDDSAHPELIRHLGDHVDAIAHELAELLDAPSPLHVGDADDREVRGAPMLTSIPGGTP